MIKGRVGEWLGRRTTAVMLVCGLFLAGLIVARFGLRVPLWFGLTVGLAAVFLRRGKMVRLVLLCMAALMIGVWRGGVFYGQLQPYRQLAYQKVTVEVVALEDAVYAANGQLSFVAGDVRFVSPESVAAKGQIKVKGFGELSVYRGDRVSVTGKLYPTRGGSQASISYAQLDRIGGHQTVIDEFRQRFSAGVQTALPEPLASFGLGLLVGQRNTLPEDTTQALKMVGLTHIIAVSGANLTILLNAARRLMGRRSKLLTTAVAVGLMVTFLLLTGASPSIVRAAVVSTLGLAAWYVGREQRAMVLILLAAALTAGFNPVYLWADIGWYLSFLAFFGILMLAPLLLTRLWPGRTPPLLGQVAVETVSAEIMTIPLVMFIFGQVSLIGLVANVLVVTFIPLAMLLTFVAGLVGMWLPLLVGWVAWPARLLLTYLLDTAQLLSRVPHIFRTNTFLTGLDMVLCYVVVLFGIAALYRPRRQFWAERLERLSWYGEKRLRSEKDWLV